MNVHDDFHKNPKCLIARSSVYGDSVRKLATYLLDKQDFYVWSGSSKPFQHHYGEGD